MTDLPLRMACRFSSLPRGDEQQEHATTTNIFKILMATAIYAGFVPCPLTRMTRASVERRPRVRDALIPRRML